jgi:hypothetical protein
VSSPLPPSATMIHASDDANGVMWTPDTNIIPQPIRGSIGANILGPQNVPIDRQNPDFLAPPSTDSGTMFVSNS